MKIIDIFESSISPKDLLSSSETNEYEYPEEPTQDMIDETESYIKSHIKNGHIRANRFIVIRNRNAWIENLSKETPLGQSWSFGSGHYDAASGIGNLMGGKKTFLEADIPVESIDWLRTIGANLSEFSFEEEIVVKKGHKIILRKINDGRERPLKIFEHGIECIA
ncbi:MAG: hypothetical protein WC284_14465 [Candidimonas sp.]